MRSLSKKILAYSLAAGVLFLLPGCKKTGGAGSDPTTYVYTPADQPTGETGFTEENTTAAERVRFAVDPSWQKNYSLQYRYFDISQSEDVVNIRETRTDDAFCAEYTDRGDILYYKENGGDIDSYVILKDAENVHSVIPRKSIDDLSSTFMKLSAVSEEMPEYTNVMYMGEENVSGRPCRKYIQRAYQNGAAQETVYVWVDKEFGFAAKGESYNESDTLTISWELTYFRSGGVTDSAMRVNLDAYTFTEQ